MDSDRLQKPWGPIPKVTSTQSPYPTYYPEDACEKIEAGASAEQIYTGFVYEGPAVVKRINQGLIRLTERDGFQSMLK